MEILCGLGKAEGSRCKDALKEGAGRVLDGNLVFLGVTVEGGDVVADDECEVEKCEFGVYEGMVMGVRETFSKKTRDERRVRMFADKENGGDSSKREEIVEEE